MQHLSVYFFLFIDEYNPCNRPMNESDKNGSSHQKVIHGSREDDVGATSDSGYFDAEDKSYSSNSPDVAIMNGETKTR